MRLVCRAKKPLGEGAPAYECRKSTLVQLPGFPPHASRPARRLDTLKRFHDDGVQTQATVSPLMPLADPQAFARALDIACD